jgi:glycosyltransferase involved in cell wall biosynthesis
VSPERGPSIGIFFARPDRGAYLARGLRARGFAVTEYKTAPIDGEPHVRVPWRVVPALRRACLGPAHDVYLTALCFLPPFCLEMNRRLRGRPYVFNLTGAKWETFGHASRGRPLPGLFEGQLYPWLLERTFAGAARIVCNSRFLAERVARRYPRHAPRVTTIYNGIEAERFAGGRRIAIPGIRAGDPVLLSVTSLAYERKARGLGLVLDAFERVWRSSPRVRLVVAAKAGDPRLRAALDADVARRACRDAVIVLYDARNVPDLLASADVFVYATPDDSNDSLPRALLEAQAAGLPAVTTGTVGCAEVVGDGITGLVVPYRAEDFAAAVETLVGTPGLRRAMAERAPAVLRTRFDWDRMADAYAALFLDMRGGRATVAA